MGQTPVKNPTYTAASGVTVHGASYIRIGHIVILSIQISLPSALNGSTLVTFSNLPTPLRSDTFFTVSNGDKSRCLDLSSEKILKSAGDITNIVWVSGTVIYATNELI